MPDLSACYFCGAAADAPVREYDVVPDAADESLRSTATLCGGCRSKLETVLSSVVRGARASDEPVDVELSPVDGSDAAASGASPSLDVETEDILAAADSARDDAAGSGATDDPLGNQTENAAGSDPADGIAFDDGADASASSGDVAEETADDQSSADAAASGSPADPSASGSSASPSASGGAPSSGGTSPSGGASASTGASDADVERPDTATYNRVVRLLQNREFPVNRSEFSDLASSAYDIPADECATVIDYAIHRGELVENRGMLKKP